MILRFSNPQILALWLLAAGGVVSAGTIGATATYTDTPISGGFQYDLTLQNTGTTDIGTFWFSWVPGVGFLSAMPTGIVAPSGWSEAVTNTYAIEYTTTTAPLAPGQSLAGFQFDSSETPAQLMGTDPGTGDPVTTSFVYIAAPFGDPGLQFVATPAPGPTTVPEPGSWLLVAAGMSWIGYVSFTRARKRAD